jgi:hypothetical protein
MLCIFLYCFSFFFRGANVSPLMQGLLLLLAMYLEIHKSIALGVGAKEVSKLVYHQVMYRDLHDARINKNTLIQTYTHACIQTH